MRKFLDNSGLLVCGTVLALVWANVSAAGYQRAAHPLQFVVNDIGMAFFFALAAKEIVEATAPGGALHSLRRSSLPLLAAVGGMLGPAMIYLALARASDAPYLAKGWAIPCATDIAFSYLAARAIFGAKHPAIPFLLLLAIADDALGLMIIAMFYPTGPIHPVEFFVILLAACGLAWWLRRRATLNFWPYILGPGVMSWIAFRAGGLHSALALVPIMPFLPRGHDENDALNEFEHQWTRPVQVMLFFFGFVNAGVAIAGVGVGTWIVLAAIMVGKPLGILAAAGGGLALGLHKPRGVTWADLAVLGTIAGVGFTVALFFATASFPPGPLLDQTKLGALLSFSSAGVAAALARVLRKFSWER